MERARGLSAARPRFHRTSFRADKPDFVCHPCGWRAFISLGAPSDAPPCTARLAPHAQDATNPGLSDGPPRPLFSLAPDWVFRAAVVAFGAVGSYPTFSPLPCGCPHGGLIFCDTVRHGALKRRAPSFRGNPALWCPDFPLRIHSARFNPHLQRTRSEDLAPKLATAPYESRHRKQGSSRRAAAGILDAGRAQPEARGIRFRPCLRPLKRSPFPHHVHAC